MVIAIPYLIIDICCDLLREYAVEIGLFKTLFIFEHVRHHE